MFAYGFEKAPLVKRAECIILQFAIYFILHPSRPKKKNSKQSSKMSRGGEDLVSKNCITRSL